MPCLWLRGLYPLDAAVPSITDPGDRARWIYEVNLGAIRQTDIVPANANDFRGMGEPDSGAAFEIGFAVATGKPVWVYTMDRRQSRERMPSAVTENGLLCEKGFFVEDFGLPMNCVLDAGRSRGRGKSPQRLRAKSPLFL
jgi:nucleoside 2-deoxyribosyltransferase